MKRVTSLFVIATLLVVFLAACTTEPDQRSEAVPGVTEAVPGVTEAVPGAIEPMPGVTEPSAASGESETGYPTPEETAAVEAPAVETPAVEPAATEAVESTEAVIPPTGPMDAGRVSNLLGAAVSSQDGEQIGQVDDFIVDLSNGAVTYAVVAVNAEDGSDQLLVPVPIAFLSWDPNSGALMLATDKQTVLGAPYFEGGEYPDTQVADWDAEFLSYWQSAASPGG